MNNRTRSKQSRETASDLGMSKIAGDHTDDPSSRRIFLLVEGEENTGKSTLMLQAPGPIGVMDYDLGMEGMAEDYVAETGKDIQTLPLQWQVTPGDKEKTAKDCEEVWRAAVQAMNHVLSSGKFRSLGIDTGSEMWELMRLARFGKLDRIKAHHYAPVNAEFQGQIKAYRDYETNVIMLHQLKEEYKTKVVQGSETGVPTGNMIRAGFKQMKYIAPNIVRCMRDDDEGVFGVKVLKAKRANHLVGMEFWGDDAAFPALATMMVPGTEEEYWT